MLSGMFLLLMLISFKLGLYINTSDSIPTGVYLQEFGANKKLQRGKFVAFCPPNKPIFQTAKQRRYIAVGLCAGSLGIILKQVAAIAGDIVSINQDGVMVNGRLLPFSKPLIADNQQRSLPQISLHNYQLKDDEILLMTDHNPASFDARYFGVINASAVKHAIRLIKPSN